MAKVYKILTKFRTKIMLLLLVVAFLMTSNTFAYWSDTIEGTSDDYATSITIGEYGISNPLFTLSSEYDEGVYSVSNPDYFTDNPGTTHSFNETFSAEWLYDSSWVDSYIITGDIEFDYEIEIVKSNGNSVGTKKYDRLIPYIEVEFDEDNASNIILNEDTDLFGFTLNVTEPTNSNHYGQLDGLTIIITITYTIDNVTYEYIYN